MAELISSGRYESERAVLSEAVRLLQRREARWAEFEASIVEAIEESDRGGGYSVDEVFDEILSAQRREERLAELMASIERGIEDSKNGLGRPAAEVFDEIRRELRAQHPEFADQF